MPGKAPRPHKYASSLLEALREALSRLCDECSARIVCVLGEEELNQEDLPEGVPRPDVVVVVEVRTRNRVYRVMLGVEYAGGRRGQPKDVKQALEGFEAAQHVARRACSIQGADLYIPVLHMHGGLPSALRKPPVRVSCDTSVNRANRRILEGWLRGLRL